MTRVNLFRSPLASILAQCNFEIQEELISQPKRLINHPTQLKKGNPQCIPIPLPVRLGTFRETWRRL